ncbi:MAG: sensor histidine kinase [Bacteroidetes bacterium]|nr:sensor histidine kinase [Bacteroidota bacterium]
MMLACCAQGLLKAQADMKQAWVNKLNQSRDTSKVLNFLGYGRWWEDSNMDSAAAYYKKAGALAQKLNYTTGILSYYANYTYVLNQQGKLDESLRLNLEALDIARKKGTHQDVADCLFNTGSCYNNLGNYDKALTYYIDAAHLLETLHAHKDLITVYDNIGGVFTNSGQYQKGLYYHTLALQKAKLDDDSMGIAKTLINIGNSYNLLNNTADAEKNIRQGLAIARIKNNTYLESIALNTLAGIYNGKNQFREAAIQAYEALRLAKKIDSKYAETEALKTILTSYLSLKAYDSCIVYANTILHSGNGFQNGPDTYKTYDMLAEAYAGHGDFANAFSFLKKSKHLQDSINKIEVERKMQKLESDYVVAKNERQILSLEQEKKRQQLFIISLAGAIVVGFLIALLIYRNVQSKQKSAEQQAMAREKEIATLQQEQQLLAAGYILKGQEDERSRLARDLHDGLGGLLSGIKLSLMSRNDAMNDKSMLQLDYAISEMRRIAHSMMPEALVRFGLQDALQDFCTSFAGSDAFRLHFQSFGLEERLHQNIETVIYRIVQELVTNAIKHSQAKDIYIQLVRTEHEVNLTVEDNGIGFDKDAPEIKHGMGFKNVINRVEYLNGRLDIQSEKGLGTTITIDFNL